MKHFFKKTLSLALAVLFTLGAVSATAFVGLLPAAAEGESTLGATAACSGHTLGTFNNVPACVNADDELHICKNNFPDDNFRQICKPYNGKTYDTDWDGHLSYAEIKKVTEINCTSWSIKSISGIEFFKELTALYCSDNYLSMIDLSKNTKLKILNCSDNILNNIDLSNNKSLEQLYCSYNPLVRLDVTNNTFLTELSSVCNPLTSLDLSNNPNLVTLNCSDNRLETLNISGCASLSSLSCYNNNLTFINANGCISLATLKCYNNELSSINVGDCVKLSKLWCYYNNLSELDVSSNSDLHDLRCFYNKLPTIDISKNTNLSGIRCYAQYTEITAQNYKAVDMHTLIPEENLSKVTIDSDIGTYDPETGIITFNAERTSFKYYYDIGKDGSTMDVTVTLKMHEHTYGDYVSNGDGTHTRHCTFDGCTDTETENCSGGTATCKDKAVCEICGEEYGELNPENHTGEEVWDQTETKHTKKWNCCGKVTVAESDHEFEDGVCTVCAYPCTHKDENTDHLCDICGKAITNHVDENNNHVCDICGKTVSNHIDSNTDHVCDICGKTVSNHVDDNNNHICDLCGKAITNHVDENNNHVCDICGKTVSNHIDSNTDHVCDICGKAVSNHVDDDNNHVCDTCGKAISNHVDSNNDHVCDICGKAVSNHVDDDNNHVCDICGKTVTNHVDDDNNHICDLCGKTVSNHSDENHDHICDICGETISAHTGGTATCKDKAVCEICGEAYGELDANNHTGGTHIEHEKAATCTEKGYTGDTYCNGCNEKIADGSEIPTKPHTPSEKWVIENGKKVKKCTECGAIAETAPRMPGDVDGDGEITALDYLYLKRYILGTFSGEIVLENADVDGDGKIDATDYLYLKRGYLGTFDLSKFA